MESPILTYGAKDYYEIDGVRVLVVGCQNPLASPSSASEILRHYFSHYNADVLLFHWDVWAIGEVARKSQCPFILYCPIDAELTRKWKSYFEGALRIVAYSKFGYEQLRRFFSPSQLALIYHGVNTDVFRPLDESKEELRRQIEAYPPIPEDRFLFTFTGANYGCRKMLYNLLLVFREVAKECRDAHLYLHTTPNSLNGYDLMMAIEELDLKDKVSLPPPNVLFPLSDEDFARIYNASDVYVSLSSAEGFGLPLLEAASCGCPLIAPANSSQKEIVEGAGGWLIECVAEDVFICCPPYVPTLQRNPVPNMRDAVEKMIYAYEHPEECGKRGQKAREFALQFDWRKIIPKWLSLFDEIEEEMEMWRSCGMK
ncbi:MAG: glycosyltransferase family 4 protein [Methanosarcinales archaeon]